MTGRNEQCPCGSGLKYKKCCLRDDTTVSPEPPIRDRSIPPEILAELERKQREIEKHRRMFGETRPVVSTEFGGHRIVAVGNEVHWDKNWKTFPDFLFYYIKKMLGWEWGNDELAKPNAERHPILQWYAALCEMQRITAEQSDPDKQGIYASTLDGPSRAYMLLAYDLYIVRGHAALQASLIKRLKHPDQFQGARYELFVAATLIRAGCDIEFENESDPSSKHTEFVATHRATGQQVSVEAKSRHRPGVLGRIGTPHNTQGFRAGIGRLLRNALRKRPDLPYLIFIDANMPPEVASPLGLVGWRREIDETVLAVDIGVTPAGLVVGSGFNWLVVTNTPDHYAEQGGRAPGYLFYVKRPLQSVIGLRDPRILDAVEDALPQAVNIPQEFPDDN